MLLNSRPVSLFSGVTLANVRGTPNNRLQRTIGAVAIRCAPLAAEPACSADKRWTDQLAAAYSGIGATNAQF
jgi:hypothetical protein